MFMLTLSAPPAGLNCQTALHTTALASVIINNLLTLIGGYNSSTITNQLFSLTGHGSDRRWTEEFPPMPTRRYGSTAHCTETALIVAGGWSKDYSRLKTVEVLQLNSGPLLLICLKQRHMLQQQSVVIRFTSWRSLTCTHVQYLPSFNPASHI